MFNELKKMYDFLYVFKKKILETFFDKKQPGRQKAKFIIADLCCVVF